MLPEFQLQVKAAGSLLLVGWLYHFFRSFRYSLASTGSSKGKRWAKGPRKKPHKTVPHENLATAVRVGAISMTFVIVGAMAVTLFRGLVVI